MEQKSKHIPLRRCIGCMQSKPKAELLRMVMGSSEPKSDKNGDADGRGCYICLSQECIDKAVKKKAFYRAFKNLGLRENAEKSIEALIEECRGICKGN